MVRLKKIYPTERYGKFANLQELVSSSAMRFGDKPLYKYFDADGQIREMSYCTFGNATRALGTALAARGLLGKRIAIHVREPGRKDGRLCVYHRRRWGNGPAGPASCRPSRSATSLTFLKRKRSFSRAYEKALLEMAPNCPVCVRLSLLTRRPRRGRRSLRVACCPIAVWLRTDRRCMRTATTHIPLPRWMCTR